MEHPLRFKAPSAPPNPPRRHSTVPEPAAPTWQVNPQSMRKRNSNTAKRKRLMWAPLNGVSSLGEQEFTRYFNNVCVSFWICL